MSTVSHYTKEKIAEAKKIVLQTVEMLLEENVTEDMLISACKILSGGDFKDVIEERNILYLCGYPICSNTIQVPKQKYHISTKVNKVYDITERKCFCSNICFKASKFLQDQLSANPVWLRREETKKVKLLPADSTKGIIGEEIDFGHIKLTEDEIVGENHLSDAVSAVYDTNLQLMNEIKKCAAQFKNLEIKEKQKANSAPQPSCEISNSKSRNHSSLDSSAHLPAKKSGINSVCDDLNMDSDCNENVIECYDEDDDRYFLSYENSENLDEKYMPVVSNPKVPQVVMINPINVTSNKTLFVQSPAQFDFVQKSLKEWITEETLNFIFGQERVEVIKTELLKNSVRAVLQKIDTSRYQEEYLKLCLKLDRLEMQDSTFDGTVVKESEENIGLEQCIDNVNNDLKEPSLEDKLAVFFNTDLSALNPKPNPVRKKPKKGRKKKPIVATAVNTLECSSNIEQLATTVVPPHSTAGTALDKISEKPAAPPPVEPVLPLVDSLSQNALRRQVVVDRLKHVYLDLLPFIGMYYKDISDDIVQLVATFRLTSTNVVFRPLQWKFIAIILLRMLRFKTNDLIPEESFSALLEKVQLKTQLSNTLVDLDKLVSIVTDCKEVFGL